MSKYRALPKKYDELDDSDKRMLYVLSVIYQPVQISHLNAILKTLGWADEKNKALKLTKSGREILIESGLLLYPKNELQCAPEVVEYITQTFGDKDVFHSVADAVKKIIPIPGFISYVSREQYLRKLRQWIYLDEVKPVWEALRIQSPMEPVDFDELGPFRDIVLPINFAWIRERSLSIQIQALIPAINERIMLMKSTQGLIQGLQEQQGEGYFNQPVFHHAVIEYQLLAGESPDFSSLEYDNHEKTHALLGWYDFLKQDNDSAIAHFAQAVSVKRKITRKRSASLIGWASVFYSLALLKNGSAKSLAELGRHCKYIKENEVLTEIIVIHELIDLYRLNKSKPNAEALLLRWGREEIEEDEPYVILIYCACLKWQGIKLDSKYLKQLSDSALIVAKEGYHWFSREAEVLLSDLKKNTGKNKTEDIFSQNEKAVESSQEQKYSPVISGLIKTVEPWERALSELALLAPDGDDKGNSSVQSQQRMVWVLEERTKQYFVLEPREQKLTKSGTWSKGRAVALKRLMGTDEQIDYLTSEDKQICATIRMEVEYGYYRNTTYALPRKESLLAAVGHPQVYWSHDLFHPVTLMKAEPELHLQKKGSNLLIELTPYPHHGGEDDIHVHKYNEYQVHLTTFNQQHITIAGIIGEKGLTVPVDAEEKVLQSLSAIAPLLTIHSDIEGLDTGAETLEPNDRLQIHLQPFQQGLKVGCYSQPFGEGGQLFMPGVGRELVFADIEGKKYQTHRHIDEEKKRFNELVQQCPNLVDNSDHLSDQGNEWYLDEPEQALTVLQELQQAQQTSLEMDLHWPKGSPIKLRNTKSAEQMQVSIRRQRDWFSLDGQMDIGEGDVLSLQNLMELVQQSPGRFVQLKEGEFIALTEDLQKRLSAMAKLTDNGRFHALASPALDDITADMKVKSSKPWTEQKKKLEEAYQLTPEVPSTLQAELRSYQQEGFGWLTRLAHWGAGACLADDMGLGKTLQSLALILSRAKGGPTLVMAPTSVCFNWAEEAMRFAPTLNVKTFGRGDREKMLNSAGAFDLIICSYGLLQTQGEKLKAVKWHTIVADEAQAIKNPQTKRSKAAMALEGDFKMIATGTPIENHLGELWNLFHFINPGLLGSLEQFNQRFASPIENEKNHQVRLQLKQLIQPFILRRLKSEVLTELPARTEITLHVEQSKEEKAFYEAVRRNALKNITDAKSEKPGQQRIKMLAEVMRLRRACCHPQLVMPDSQISSAKLAVFAETLDELLENKHKALVFSQFVDHLKIIKAYLDDRGIGYQYLDGSTPANKRKKAVDAFQSGEGDVFLISLKAGGSGLNLTAADYVIHMDPWWNPAVEDQASDRAHRMGQKRPVTIYRLVTSDTIEAKIVDMHTEKRDLASNLLEGTEMSGKISLDDMVNLIKGF